jgi:ethanolamine transporter EutH
LSQPVETQLKRKDHSAVAGVMIIVSACLLIVFNLAWVFQYSSYVSINSSFARDVFWISLPNLAVSVTLDILALLGGVQALARRRLMFAVFGTSVLITISLTGTTSIFASLARALTLTGLENFAVSDYEVFAIAVSPVILVLSVLSLIFLARSRHEFS